MTDSIIIYRNPAEKAFWEGGYATPFIVFIIVMAVTFFTTYQLLKLVTGKRWNEPQWFAWASGIIGISAGSMAFYWMWVFTH